ncbi:MAG TPA: zf-HC2 domain-containing protein [Ktedonobacterales bacterium]|nr:zf-HC2 domain-containing protein [Ktedonobacterales bacterium]
MTPELTCSECRQRLPWYVVGPLSPEERAALTHHLAHCTACQREADLWGAISAALERADGRVPSDAHELSRWHAVRSRLPERPLVVPAQTREERLVDDYQTNPQYPQYPVCSSRPVGRTPSERPFRHRSAFALLATALLITLSAAFFGLFGARVHHGKSPAVSATSTPTPPPCASSAVSATLPPNSQISAISMASAHDGWAVGQIWNPAHDATPPSLLVLHFQGCHWMPVSDYDAVSTPSTELFSVAMDSATDGWAVGTSVKDYPVPQQNGTTTHQWVGDKLLVLHYVNGQWQHVDLPAVDSAIYAKVVMTSPEEGWMLVDGGKSHTGPYTAVYAYHLFHYLNGAWHPVPLTFDTSGSLIIWDVAAIASGECWVVGYGTTSADHFAAAHYANGRWQVWSPTQVGASGASLYRVALGGPDDAWVVGSDYYQDTAGGSHNGPFVSHFTGGNWVKQQLPAAPDQEASDLTLVSIAMLSPAEGWAFAPDRLSSIGHLQAEALHYVDGQWHWVTLPSPIIATYELSPFSPTGGFGIADTLANLQATSPQVQEGHLLYYDNGAWSVVPTR